jgi:predicted secreted Zn-dependent protease
MMMMILSNSLMLMVLTMTAAAAAAAASTIITKTVPAYYTISGEYKTNSDFARVSFRDN